MSFHSSSIQHRTVHEQESLSFLEQADLWDSYMNIEKEETTIEVGLAALLREPDENYMWTMSSRALRVKMEEGCGGGLLFPFASQN